jgi:hypothetical protein
MTAPTGETSINFGTGANIDPPAEETYGIATFSGGAFLLPSSNVYGGTSATPPGSTKYWSIGISGANGTIDVGSLKFSTGLSTLSFEWGSPDAYNTITFYDKFGNAIGSYTGLSVEALGPSFNLGDQSITRYFTISSPSDPIYSAILSSPSNAFETASYGYVAAVPEPQEWAFLIGGLGLMGFASFARRRNRSVVSTATA